ncbi:MAG: hypothetical protein AAGI38_16145 [Bacteroidota bacterium]
MGKRLERILSHELEEKLSEWQGKEVHAVTWEQGTYYGILKEVNQEEKELMVEDLNSKWYNRSRHRHTLTFGQIREIIADHVTEW